MGHSPLSVIIRSTIGVLVGDFGKLCLLAWKPFVILFAAEFVFGFIEGFSGIRWLLPIGDEIMATITGALFVLAVHRYRLLGWNSETKRVPLRFGTRELRFLGFVAILSFCARAIDIRESLLFKLGMIENHNIISSILFSAPVFIAVFILPVATLLIAPGLLLTLPAIALDHPHPLAIGWRFGRQTYWKLFGIVLFVGIPTVLVSRYVLSNVTVLPLQIVIDTVLRYVPPAVGAIALCFVFQQYSESTPTASATGHGSPGPS